MKFILYVKGLECIAGKICTRSLVAGLPAYSVKNASVQRVPELSIDDNKCKRTNNPLFQPPPNPLFSSENAQFWWTDL